MDVALSEMGIDGGAGRMILALDPGRAKCGWALGDSSGELFVSGIFLSPEAAVFLKAALSGKLEAIIPFAIESRQDCPSVFPVDEILVGNGTAKEHILFAARSLSFEPKIIPERGTTLIGRDLYWKKHPPRGLRKLIPRGLRVPPRDIDDFAAWAIMLKYLEYVENAGKTGQPEK